MKRKLHVVVGLLIGAFLIWLLFRDTDWAEVWAATRRANIWWLSLATFLIVLTFFVRVQRWTYIVRTAKPVSYRHMFSATQIGFLGNFLLPARLGELVRAGVLTRLTRIHFSKSIAMVALDRVLDLVGLITIVAITLLVFTPQDHVIPKETLGWEIRFSANQVRLGELFATVMLVGAITAFGLLYVMQERILALSDRILGLFSRKLADKVHHFLGHFVEGLHVFRSGSDMAKSIAFSLLTWAICVLVFVCMLEAFNIEYPWYTAFVVELFLAIAISVPGPPGFIGQFQAPIIIGLVTLTTADDATAKAFAILAHILNMIPVAIVGLICIYMERFSVTELQEDTMRAEQEQESPEEPAVQAAAE